MRLFMICIRGRGDRTVGGVGVGGAVGSEEKRVL